MCSKVLKFLIGKAKTRSKWTKVAVKDIIDQTNWKKILKPTGVMLGVCH